MYEVSCYQPVGSIPSKTAGGSNARLDEAADGFHALIRGFKTGVDRLKGRRKVGLSGDRPKQDGSIEDDA